MAINRINVGSKMIKEAEEKHPEYFKTDNSPLKHNHDYSSLQTFNWQIRKEHNHIIKRPIKIKLPMRKTIIDSEGQMFSYDVFDGKLEYTYLGVTFLIK